MIFFCLDEGVVGKETHFDVLLGHPEIIGQPDHSNLVQCQINMHLINFLLYVTGVATHVGLG